MLAAASTAIMIALSGCGLGVRLPAETSPARSSTQTAQAAGKAPRVRTHELPTPPGPEERAAGESSPVAAVRRFASGYINWDAADVGRQLAELGADSVGQARTAMRLEASETRSDQELTQAGVANHGRVEAVAALGDAGRYVVVTLESTTATDSSAYQGLAPAWHLTVATVARHGGRWVISGWQPEN